MPPWLIDRWPLKLAALVLSLVIWLVVSSREPSEEVVTVRFAPEMDSSLRLISEPPALRALVIGRGRELMKLYSTPVTYRPAFGPAVADTVRLSLTPSEIVVPPGVDVLVRDIRPRNFEVRFAATLRKVVPVKSALTLAPDASVRVDGPPRLEPESVTVTGPRRAVVKVDSITTVRETRVICDDAAWRIPLDTTGIGARVRPASVTARVPVTRISTRAFGPACAPTRSVRPPAAIDTPTRSPFSLPTKTP